jgi:hypothetical protein
MTYEGGLKIRLTVQAATREEAFSDVIKTLTDAGLPIKVRNYRGWGLGGQITLVIQVSDTQLDRFADENQFDAILNANPKFSNVLLSSWQS